MTESRAEGRDQRPGMRRRTSSAVAGFCSALTALLLSFAAPSRAQADEILVNDDVTGGCDQNHAGIAALPGGRFAAVWHDYRKSDYDPDIYCQIVDRLGEKSGENRIVNRDGTSRDYLSYRQLDPVIAARPAADDGKGDAGPQGIPAIVAWQDYRNGKSNIYYQMLDTAGALFGGNLRASDDTNTQTSPAVTACGAGFALAWELRKDSFTTTIWGTVVDSLGNPGTAFRVDDNVRSESSEAPALAGHDHGFVAAWCQLKSYPGEPELERSIRLRWFDERGVPLGGSEGVPARNVSNPRVACDRSGNCLAVWEETPMDRIWAQAFDSLGRARGPAFAVNAGTSSWGMRPFVTAGADGRRFVVAWEGLCVSRALIYAQVLDRLGSTIGNSFLLDSAEDGWQGGVAVALGASPSRSAGDRLLTSGNSIAAVWADTRDRDRNIRGSFFGSCTTRFRVNDDRASALQDFPVITLDGRGRSSLFWFDYRNSSDVPDIYAQRFDSAMSMVGANFRVNDAPPGTAASFLWAATSRAGQTVVAWEDHRNIDPDIYAQIYDSLGRAVGPNLRVNDNYDESDQTWPCVAMNEAGDFVAVWSDSRFQGVAPFGQVFNRYGERVGHNCRLDTIGREPAAWIGEDGSVFGCWKADDGIRFRQFGQDLQSGSATLFVNDDTCRTIAAPEIAVTTLGTKWIIWMDGRRGKWEVFGQRIDSRGWPIGPNFRINDDLVLCDHILPVPYYDGAERIYVTWTDFRIPGDWDVRCQVFDTCGTALDTNFIVNNNLRAGDHQWAYGSVAARDGRIIFAWLDNRNHRSWDVYARQGTATERERSWWRSLLVMPSVVKRFCEIMPAVPVGGNARLLVYDAAGRMMRSLPFAGYTAQSSIRLDCAGLNRGVYYAVLRAGNVTFRSKFVVRK